DGNDQKGGERGAGGAIANPGEGFGQEDADPAPHGDQLPHMTEVAAYGQAGAAVGKNFADLDRIKVRAGEREGAFRACPAAPEGPGGGEQGGDQHDGAPAHTAHRLHQVRKGGAHRERPHHDPQGHAAAAAEPGGHKLQGGRVDEGQKRTRKEAPGPGGAEAMTGGQGGIAGGGGQSSDHDETSGGDQIRQIDQG